MPSFITQFREDTGEEYSDYTDTELAKAFHAKYEADEGIKVDYDEFATEFGIPKVVEEPKPQATELLGPAGEIQYEHTDTGPQPVSTQKLDLGQETIQSHKLDAGQETSDMSLRGANTFLGTPEFDAEKLTETVYPDSTLDAVTKAYNNIPEDFLLQYYGLQISTLETKAQEVLTITEEDRQRELERMATHGRSFVSDAALQPEEARLETAGALEQEVERLYGKLEESEKGREPLFVEPGSVSYYASAGVSSLANTLPALVAGVFAGPQTSLLLFYAQAKGKAYLDGRDAGLSPEMANDYSTYTGLAEAIPELIPLHQILKPGVNFFTRVAKGAVAEVIQEEITESLQIGLDKGYINEDMTWAEARSRLVDAGILASIIGPTQAAIAHPLVKAKEMVTNSPIRLANELNKDISATDLSVDDAEIIARMDPNQVAPENSAQAHIIEATQESVNLDEEIRKIEEGFQPVDGDRRHEAGRAATGDRRKDVEQRVKVADMAPEQMQKALLTSDVTNIPNKRAYEEAEPLPVQVSVDADSLKWINDNMSPESGDQMLKAIGQALSEETEQAFHISGDEFMVQANNEAEAGEIMEKVNNRLKDAEVHVERPDGEIVIKKGLSITHGLGETKNVADFNLKKEKARREEAGERAERGTEPPGITRQRAEGKPDIKGEVAEEKKVKAETEGYENIPDSLISEFPDFQQTNEGYIAVSNLSENEQKALREAGLVEDVTNEEGTVYEGVNPENLWEERKRRQAKAKEKKTTVDKDTVSRTMKAREKRYRDAADEALESGDKERYLELSEKADDIYAKEQELHKKPEPKSVKEKKKLIASLPDSVPKKVYRGYGRKDRKTAYSGGAVPIMGKGEYYTYTEKKAKRYGDKVEEIGVEFNNPLVIDSAEQWREITKELGWEFPNPTGRDEKTLLNITDKFRNYALDKGHDAVIVTWPDEVERLGYDFYEEGGVQKGVKLLYDVFGERQVFIPESKEVSVSKKPSTAKPVEKKPVSKQVKKLTKKKAKKPDDKVRMAGRVESISPGQDYRSFISDKYDPAEFTTEFSRDPVRREEVLQRFAKGVGTRLYQKRVKGKATLGFFRPGVDEVRIKNMNDLETAAHEIAHFLDDKLWNGFGRRRGEKETRPWLHGPKARVYAKELKGVSYDKSKTYEGFAEFIRHWMTRPEIALKAAPEFFIYWENEIVRLNKRYGPALDRAQKDISSWFDQRAIERAVSKIGDSGIVINDAMDGMADRTRQAVFDDLHALLMMETTLTGAKTATSGGPYETARLMRGAHAIVDGALRYGPPVIETAGKWSFRDRDGNLDTIIETEGKKQRIANNPEFNRWGLRDVLAPVSDQIDEWTLYATGLAAQELMGQGREHLFKQDEIDAMIDMGRDRPHFKRVFDDYQKWNNAILDFAEQTGIIGRAQRKQFRRTMYIPFYRVSEGAGVTKKVSVEGHTKAVHMLTGGTNNLNDILGNMVQNASGLIVEGIKNHARREAVKFAQKQMGGKEGLGGGQFLTHISKDTKEVQVTKDQVIDKFMKAAFGMTYAQYKAMSKMGKGNPVIDEMITDVELNMADFVKMYMYAQPPKGSDIIAVMSEGKPEFYQVADPMLMRSFQSFNRKHPGLIRKWFSAIKRIGQSSITLTADFMAANIWRDTIHGFVISKHGFVPVLDSLKGMRSRMLEDANYRAYIANGGGFSSYLVDPEAFEANLSQFYGKRGIDFKTVLNTPKKMLLGLEMLAESFEVSTRLGEAQRGIETGETPRTAAFGAREVSVDFAMRGDSEALNVAYDTILFLKAGMNGLDRIYRGFTKDPNKVTIMAKSAGIAAASVALYTLNRGNPCYDDLEDWDKDTHWHAFIPKEGGGNDCDGKYTHLRFPKIWEIGAIASGAERTMGLYLDKIETGYADGKEYALRMQKIFTDLFKMEYLPQAVAPIAEVYWLNKNRFSQRQIENQQQQELLPFARYSPYTNRTLVEIAELTAELPPELQFSPQKSEALIRGYFNTWGMYGLFMSDEMLMGDKLPAWRTDQYPVLRRFTRSHPMRHTQYEREYWDLVREAGMYAKTGQDMIKKQKEFLAENFLEQDPAPLFDMLNEIKSSTKEINNAMVMIYNDPELTPEQKRDQRSELQGEKNKLFKDVMIDVNKSRGQ